MFANLFRFISVLLIHLCVSLVDSFTDRFLWKWQHQESTFAHILSMWWVEHCCMFAVSPLFFFFYHVLLTELLNGAYFLSVIDLVIIWHPVVLLIGSTEVQRLKLAIGVRVNSFPLSKIHLLNQHQYLAQSCCYHTTTCSSFPEGKSCFSLKTHKKTCIYD